MIRLPGTEPISMREIEDLEKGSALSSLRLP